MSTHYDSAFFDGIQAGARPSARVVIPQVLDLCSPQRPRSVVDVGCGLGTWLSVVQENGIDDILGIDGDYVDRSSLEIPGTRFQSRNVEQPFTLDRTFDLAISVEVAEHIAPTSAADFIATLTRLAPVILFSAAIPGQGGTHHVNEQWPEYWVEHFANNDYVAIDCLRHTLLGHPSVEFWYQQNLAIYVSRSKLSAFPRLAQEHERTQGRVPSIVHPTLFGYWKDWGIAESQARWKAVSEKQA